MVTAVSSPAWTSSPAMKLRAVALRPTASSGSWKALSSPLHNDRCVCIPEPCTPSNGLGMKVACTPDAIATSRTIILSAMTSSAIVSASA